VAAVLPTGRAVLGRAVRPRRRSGPRHGGGVGERPPADQRRQLVTYSDVWKVLDLFYQAYLRSWREADADLPAEFEALLEEELGPEPDEENENDPIENVHARIDRLESRVARLERQSR
jgi:hypothetical protein